MGGESGRHICRPYQKLGGCTIWMKQVQSIRFWRAEVVPPHGKCVIERQCHSVGAGSKPAQSAILWSVIGGGISSADSVKAVDACHRQAPPSSARKAWSVKRFLPSMSTHVPLF